MNLDLMEFILEIIYLIKDGTYVTNLDQYSDTGTHQNALYALNNNVTFFESFEVEPIPKEIKKFLKRSSITKNIYRIQAKNSVICGYFCIEFIDFMLKGKSFTDLTNLLSPNN